MKQEGFEDLRGYLFSLAYRMLGSAADAEDVVQEAYLRWQDASDVEHPKAFLSKIVTNLCIDHLKSARVRRETYVGPWLPEPLLTSSEPDAAERVEQADSISMAFLVMLETLSPVERAVFLLREVFGYSYPEVAEIVGKSEAHCRQIAHRSKQHIEARRPRFPTDEKQRVDLMTAFFNACAAGDLEGLTKLLAEDAVLWSDGGGKVKAARRPITGSEKVARFLVGILSKADARMAIQVAEVNGGPGFLVSYGDRIETVGSLDMSEGQIKGVRLVVNPDKLTRLSPR
jgi:RNA polymerase sigma-70 factor, ECF subfamily